VSALTLKKFQRLLDLVYSRIFIGGCVNQGVVVRISQHVFPVGGIRVLFIRSGFNVKIIFLTSWKLLFSG
jgi:CRISPR/Cas system-associated protein endoribonuclease Cas2